MNFELAQELHADSPHGPWAFVLSLTQWEGRSFSGGETMIFQPHMLDFWSTFNPAKGFELKDMVHIPISRDAKRSTQVFLQSILHSHSWA